MRLHMAFRVQINIALPIGSKWLSIEMARTHYATSYSSRHLNKTTTERAAPPAVNVARIPRISQELTTRIASLAEAACCSCNHHSIPLMAPAVASKDKTFATLQLTHSLRHGAV
jgi:hypothetical protein